MLLGVGVRLVVCDGKENKRGSERQELNCFSLLQFDLISRFYIHIHTPYNHARTAEEKKKNKKAPSANVTDRKDG